MTDQIKPFRIIDVRQDEGGKTVFFEVYVRTISDTGDIDEQQMSSAVFVNEGDDIERTVYDSLLQSGWIR